MTIPLIFRYKYLLSRREYAADKVASWQQDNNRGWGARRRPVRDEAGHLHTSAWHPPPDRAGSQVHAPACGYPGCSWSHSPSAVPGIGCNLFPPLRLSFLQAATAHKVALFVRSIAAPLTSKCYKVEGRQATLEVQSDRVIQAKQALNTQSTTTTDSACECSIILMLHLSGVTLFTRLCQDYVADKGWYSKLEYVKLWSEIPEP